jgi:predicted transcriptional regulator
MIPGYPMDGGRVVRAIAWRLTGSLVRATRMASAVGQFIAILFIMLGLSRFFAGSGIGGLWMAFIGWFLLQAAAASTADVEAKDALSGVRVADVMTEDCPSVDGNLNLRTFADDHLLRTGRRCFVVLENGQQSGIATVEEIKRIPRERWPFTTVSQIARSLDQVRTVSPDITVTEALQVMVQENLNQVPVVANGSVTGVISRVNVVEVLQTRTELKAA